VSNLTITKDDELLRAARVNAVQQGTSVNEVCRQAIAAFARDDEAHAVPARMPRRGRSAMLNRIAASDRLLLRRTRVPERHLCLPDSHSPQS
jgi:hypothetical protein